MVAENVDQFMYMQQEMMDNSEQQLCIQWLCQQYIHNCHNRNKQRRFNLVRMASTVLGLWR